MNLEERQQLTLFLQQLTQAQVGQKDAEADTLILEACGRQPNASYLLVQRTMQLEHLLRQTQAQVTQLQSELAQARAGTQSGFLDSNAWGKAPAAPAAQPPTMATQGPSVAPRAPAPAAGATPSWGSGLLGNVATTAAGVVAGSFLFQGIENLMGHHNQGGTSAATPVQTPTPVAENTVINNYYGSDGPDQVADASDDSGGTDDTA